MALSIKNREIIGKIDELEDKLEGKLPVDRLELLYLVNSWGRTKSFYTFNLNQDISIRTCESKECYDLSKLDTSEITNMNEIFKNSKFNRDISKWDVSNVTNMICMFQSALEFNQDISNWDVSNVTNMDFMFSRTKEFNQDISNWNLDKVDFCDYMFDNTKSFLDKYNSGKPLPSYTDKIKKWFNLNRERMNIIDIKDKHGTKIDNFFSKINNINSLNIKYK